jgi:hypothetical protein
MSNSDNGVTATRQAIDLMVSHAERQTRSRDVAYEVVAGEIDMSPSWVKKCVLSDDFVRRVRPSLLLNIRSAYLRLCESIEAEHRAELKKLAVIKGEISAATSSMVGIAQHEASNATGRAHVARFEQVTA